VRSKTRSISVVSTLLALMLVASMLMMACAAPTPTPTPTPTSTPTPPPAEQVYEGIFTVYDAVWTDHAEQLTDELRVMTNG